MVRIATLGTGRLSVHWCGCAPNHGGPRTTGAPAEPFSASAAELCQCPRPRRTSWKELSLRLTSTNGSWSPSINQTTKHAEILQTPYIYGNSQATKHVEIPADAVHRQSCCRAYCDTSTGSSVLDCERRGKKRCAVHRLFCGRPFDQPGQPGDQARRVFADTVHRPCCRVPVVIQRQVPSDTDCVEDSGSPAGAVHRQSGHACDQAEEIIPQGSAFRSVSDSLTICQCLRS